MRLIYLCWCSTLFSCGVLDSCVLGGKTFYKILHQVDIIEALSTEDFVYIPCIRYFLSFLVFWKTMHKPENHKLLNPVPVSWDVARLILAFMWCSYFWAHTSHSVWSQKNLSGTSMFCIVGGVFQWIHFVLWIRMSPWVEALSLVPTSVPDPGLWGQPISCVILSETIRGVASFSRGGRGLTP